MGAAAKRVGSAEIGVEWGVSKKEISEWFDV
jgi:hypothetical protein